MTRTPGRITVLRADLSDAELLLKQAERALSLLCDGDAAYFGSEIHITCGDHSDAIRRMAEGRAALESIRSSGLLP